MVISQLTDQIKSQKTELEKLNKELEVLRQRKENYVTQLKDREKFGLLSLQINKLELEDKLPQLELKYNKVRQQLIDCITEECKHFITETYKKDKFLNSLNQAKELIQAKDIDTAGLRIGGVVSQLNKMEKLLANPESIISGNCDRFNLQLREFDTHAFDVILAQIRTDMTDGLEMVAEYETTIIDLVKNQEDPTPESTNPKLQDQFRRVLKANKLIVENLKEIVRDTQKVTSQAQSIHSEVVNITNPKEQGAQLLEKLSELVIVWKKQGEKFRDTQLPMRKRLGDSDVHGLEPGDNKKLASLNTVSMILSKQNIAATEKTANIAQSALQLLKN